MPSYHKESNLYIDCQILTQQATAEIINGLLELLLYKRNQIPFIYKTYRYYVDKWSKSEECNKSCISFQLQRQKVNAKMTRESISAMKQLIRDIFDKDIIKTVRFLFGATSSTPKEVYTLHMPAQESTKSCDTENHLLSTQILNQLLLNLSCDETLYELFSSNLLTTNIYMDFEIIQPITTTAHNIDTATGGKGLKFFCKKIHKLPPSCKDIHFHFIPRYNKFKHNENLHLHCCNNIFGNMEQLSVNEVTDNHKSINADEQNKNSMGEHNSTWWESEIFIRGFKQQHLYNHMWS